MSDRWVIFWLRHTIHPDPMPSHMLARDDARSGRHTHHVVVMSALVIDAFGGERIDAGRPRNHPAIAAEGIEPHLICGDEQYISFFIGHHFRYLAFSHLVPY